MDEFERRAHFERLVDLRTVRRLSGDDRRVIAADGWEPDTSRLSDETAAYAAAQQRWYDQRPKNWPR